MADPADDTRPSPEALLEAANRERRGALKIFLGAAPGVGKTYAMLEGAQQQRREGVDLVVGIVETHGRQETAALLRDIEVIPRRHVEYRGIEVAEMDIDAILHRRPRLVLVDELAHTNAPGSRHLKRYQDVEEILESGINVWSTLNVQHLESLNDVVERIAGIKVRETLPDGVLRQADEIELVDLPPPELLKRLAEGKVYVPEQAQRAIANFFSPGNLTALREMALRQAAERVDAQMLSYMRTHAIPGPWPTRERILVCIGPDGSGPRVVRAAKRVADRREAPWTAAYVETHRHGALTEVQKDTVAEALRLAQQLGGDTVVMTGADITGELLAWARTHNVSQIVAGRSKIVGWRRLWTRRLTDDLLERSEDYDVLVVGNAEDETPRRTSPADKKALPWIPLSVATVAVAAATGVAWLVSLVLPMPNVSLVYLVPVLIVAARYGLMPSLYASLLSFLAYNFFLIHPRFSFQMSSPQDLLTVGFFLIAAVITAQLAGRLRSQVEATKLSQRRTQNLYEFNRRVAGAAGQDDVLWAVAYHVASTLKGKALVLLPQDDRLVVKGGYPPEDVLDGKSEAAAQWAWSHGQRAGRGSETLPAADWLFVPLKTHRGPVGVLGVQMDEQTLLTPDDSRLLDTLADQAALAFERTKLVADVEAAEIAQEKEQLRTALLSSLSHDLRTPLVSILGSATSLLTYEDQLAAPERRELALTIQEEAERLNRFVQNLLDMTRLGAGALKPHADWVDLRDVVNGALSRVRRLLKNRHVKIDIDPELPLLLLDAVLMEQVFVNLLDNAAKYSPADGTILVWARRHGGQVRIEVCDQGPGIAEEDRERVFDMFYRAAQGDSQTTGTGLGLAISRGIVEAHGGTIVVLPGLNGVGACLVIKLPATEAPPSAAATEALERV